MILTTQLPVCLLTDKWQSLPGSMVTRWATVWPSELCAPQGLCGACLQGSLIGEQKGLPVHFMLAMKPRLDLLLRDGDAGLRSSSGPAGGAALWLSKGLRPQLHSAGQDSSALSSIPGIGGPATPPRAAGIPQSRVPLVECLIKGDAACLLHAACCCAQAVVRGILRGPCSH